jgi:hypothetical protein
MDNLNIHGRKALIDAFGQEMATEVWDHFGVHYTPLTESGSIRRRSRSGFSRGNVWAAGESAI